MIEDLFSLGGKRALITGSSSGIGRAIAEAYAGAGARVAIHGTNEQKLANTRIAMQAAGHEVISLSADVGSVENCRELIEDGAEALDGLDILVNCAGMNRRKPITEVTEDDFDTILAVNLRSVYFLSQAAQPIMAENGGGKIINIGSMTTFIGLANVSVYGATKAALGQLTRTMAVEWAKNNIQVNCLAPGFIVTPLTETAVFGDPIKKSWILNRIPSGRPGYPSDMVGVALMLASPASDYVTGQLIAVDGGFLAGGSWDSDVH